jgi:hypothetical protein
LYLYVSYILSSLLSFSALAEEEAYTEISTPEGLAAIADNPDGSYILSGNIDMKGIDWTPLSFSGRLDGDGYTIYNLSVTARDLIRPLPMTAISRSMKPALPACSRLSEMPR